jgi:hypothetical protein
MNDYVIHFFNERRIIKECQRYFYNLTKYTFNPDRLCGLVVGVLGYRSRGPGSIPGTTREKSSGFGTGSIQPREYN